MDLEDSGIDMDTRPHSDSHISPPKEPIITFSPDKCRFEKAGGGPLAPLNNNQEKEKEKPEEFGEWAKGDTRPNTFQDFGVEVRSSRGGKRGCGGLIPPDRLAIPHKEPTPENKPLVQWDSEDSEEELSFFPGSRVMCEDDLHLTPPRPLARQCPCDPRPTLHAHLPNICSIT